MDLGSIQKKLDELGKEYENDPKAVNKIITYLEGLQDGEIDSDTRYYLSSVIISLRIIERFFDVFLHQKKKLSDMQSDFNNLLERVKKLEKRFDDLDAGK